MVRLRGERAADGEVLQKLQEQIRQAMIIILKSRTYVYVQAQKAKLHNRVIAIVEHTLSRRTTTAQSILLTKEI